MARKTEVKNVIGMATNNPASIKKNRTSIIKSGRFNNGKSVVNSIKNRPKCARSTKNNDTTTKTRYIRFCPKYLDSSEYNGNVNENTMIRLKPLKPNLKAKGVENTLVLLAFKKNDSVRATIKINTPRLAHIPFRKSFLLRLPAKLQ